jgi:hypothetical protein
MPPLQDWFNVACLQGWKSATVEAVSARISGAVRIRTPIASSAASRRHVVLLTPGVERC